MCVTYGMPLRIPSFQSRYVAAGFGMFFLTDICLPHQEVDIGLAPDIGSLAFLPKITGNHSLVRELTYTARGFSADEARELGLVSRVVEGGRDEVVREALALATFVAGKSPVAVSSAKHLITHSRDHRYVPPTSLFCRRVGNCLDSVPENLAYTGAWNAAALMTNVSILSHSFET